ncbi:MAG: aminotransferase class IV [Candidatus Sungbacteria bacterium]|uniref:Aminotransferase class IV n=1 Tax=Candidatus Sungiibacteriota bacterium TaxID=2750080 RepID=A0A932VRW8_9BACT|nr:aminotransferase class IV [Candidatus Sungbacteria bacterium]
MSHHQEPIHFLNGRFVKEDGLTVSVRDIGFSRGYAVFDFLISYPYHRPFMLSRHIDRLFASADLVGLALPWSKAKIAEWVMRTMDANKDPGEKAIKIIVSGGTSHSMLPSLDGPTIAIIIDPHRPFPREYYEKGAGVITVRHTRHIPRAKTNNYIEGVRQTQAAAKIGAIEPLYYDDSQILEGSNSNIFALIGGKLLTPKSNILLGITRSVLLDILSLPVPIEVADFSRDQLSEAKEVFFTGSNKEVMPITKIDGEAVGGGRVGNITKEVMRQFREFTLSDAW